MMAFLTKIKDIVLDILFPPICLVCEKSLNNQEKSRHICDNCFDSLPINNTFYCPICRCRLADNKKICHKNSPYLLATASSYDNESVKKLIWRLKYQNQKIAAKPLGQILIKYLRQLNCDFSDYLVIPIPLHKERKQERKFNQAELIAEIIGEHLKSKVLTDILIRTKYTKPQPELKDWEKRKENIKDCFALKDPIILKNQKIILVDDVFTSGATLNEAAKVIKSAGAKKIIGLVVAKAG